MGFKNKSENSEGMFNDFEPTLPAEGFSSFLGGITVSTDLFSTLVTAVFSVEDMAKVNEAAVAGNESGVKEAADCCPVSAIEIA